MFKVLSAYGFSARGTKWFWGRGSVAVGTSITVVLLSDGGFQVVYSDWFCNGDIESVKTETKQFTNVNDTLTYVFGIAPREFWCR